LLARAMTRSVHLTFSLAGNPKIPLQPRCSEDQASLAGSIAGPQWFS
jgi:hypothetical protein